MTVAVLAQSVEPVTEEQEVAGSIPFELKVLPLHCKRLDLPVARITT